MSNDQITEKGIIFPEEAAYLSEISQKLDEALEKARDDVRRIDRSTGMRNATWRKTGVRLTS